MAKRARGKLVRRLGINLYGNPKYDRLLKKKSNPPGMDSGRRVRRKDSEYARQLTEKQKQFLDNPYVGVVTTLREDGSPHSTVVWVGVDDDGVTVNTAWPRAKPR